MASEGATEFGSIKAVLTLDKSDYVRGLKEAGVQADELGRHDPTIRVDVDSAGAIAQLKAAEAAADRTSRSNTRLDTSSRSAGKGMGAMATAILTLGPALVPVAAGAAGAAVAFGGMGSAGVLAIMGIRNEMKAGTGLGNAYSTSLGHVTDSLHVLERTAAANMLGPFQEAVASLQQHMPGLNTEIGLLSTATGRAGAAITTGLLVGLQSMAPLIQTVSVYTLGLSQRFEHAMSGPGIVAFGDYARSVFPSVAQTVESIATSAGHLVVAFAPLGGGVLQTVRVLSDLLAALPVGVLTSAATAAGAVFIGFRTWQGLHGIVGGLSDKLQKIGVSAESAATGMRVLNVAAGAVGIVITALSWLVTQNAESQRQAEQAANDFADALARSNGVIDEGVRVTALHILQQQGAIDAAKRLGLGVGEVTAAATGNAEAMTHVNAVIMDAITNHRDLWSVAHDLRSALGGTNTELQNGVQKYKDTQAAIKGVTTSTTGSTLALQSMTTASAADATAIQGLNTQLDALLSRNLSLAQSQTAVDQALLTMFGTLKSNKATLNQHTAAGIADRQAIEGTVSALQSQRDQQIKAGTSVADATGKYRASSAALLVQIGKLYGTRSAAYSYAQQLLAIPKAVGTTITANSKQAVSAVQKVLDMLAGIHNKDVSVTVNYLNALNKPKAPGPGGMATGGRIPGYAGGTIVGEGTGTSDSILAMTDRGRVLRVSAGEFLSTDASRQRNEAALAAGNRGAKLAVVGQGPTGSGPIELGDATVMRLAQAMARVQLRAQITTSEFDRAMGGRMM